MGSSAGCEGGPFHVSAWLPVFPGALGHHRVSAFVFTWLSPRMQLCAPVSPFHKDTGHIGLGVHPTVMTSSSLLTSAVTPCPKKVPFPGARGWDAHVPVLRDASQPFLFLSPLAPFCPDALLFFPSPCSLDLVFQSSVARSATLGPRDSPCSLGHTCDRTEVDGCLAGGSPVGTSSLPSAE